MPLSIACSQGHEFKVAASRAGSSVRCPHCREKVVVPKPEEKKPGRHAKTKPPVNAQPKVDSPQVDSTESQTPSAEASPKPASTKSKSKRNESAAERKKRRRQRARDAKRTKKKPAAKTKPAETPTQPSDDEQPVIVLPVAPEEPKENHEPPAPPVEPTPPPTIRVELPEVEAPPAASEKIVIPPPPATKPPPLPQKETTVAEVVEPKAEPTNEAEVTADVVPSTPESAEPAAEKIVVEVPPLVTREEQAEEEPAGETGKPMPAPTAGAETKVEAEPEAVVVGYQHDAEKIWSAYAIAGSLALVGIVTMIPSGWSIVDYFRFEGETPISRWAWFLLFTGFLQIAYAIYVSQLPDFSTVWMTAIMLLVISTVYAMSLGMILLGGDPVLGIFEVHVLLRNKAGLWLFGLLCMTGLVAYFCGRVSVRWRQAFELATEGRNVNE